MSGPRIRDAGKAGASGLFLLCTAIIASVWTAGGAGAAPLELKIVRAKATTFEHLRSEPIVAIILTEASRRAYAEFTAANVDAIAELRVNGKVLMRPVIREPIRGGTIYISGGFTVAETREIARRLSSRGAKIEVEVVDE